MLGHEKGAFTSAIGQKVGRFELADCGTLFLDEIGEIPLELQSKVLRAIQSTLPSNHRSGNQWFAQFCQGEVYTARQRPRSCTVCPGASGFRFLKPRPGLIGAKRHL